MELGRGACAGSGRLQAAQGGQECPGGQGGRQPLPWAVAPAASTVADPAASTVADPAASTIADPAASIIADPAAFCRPGGLLAKLLQSVTKHKCVLQSCRDR